ncbi:NADPH-dependent FMN reductase [Dactylosporangium sp. NPDC051485]|uniref:NADPH-dependent FMN reductase n=1 Tax=Dactylosporangium sp. NPDC051485 TaxID=3154846 RepID=UPI003426DE9F
MTISVGYIVGSLSEQSINRRLADYVASRAPAGFELTEIPIRDLPLYNYDLDQQPPAAAVAFKQAIESHNSVLFVTPEYNRSIPGVLKNAIDWGSRPWGQNSWDGREAAVLGAGLNGAGTAVAQSHLRGILIYLGMTVVGTPEVCVPWSDSILDSSVTEAYVDGFWRRFAISLRTPDMVR